jgi:hypothetical protein
MRYGQFSRIVHNKFAMRRLPLAVQTLYAQLAQELAYPTAVHGSVSITRVHNKQYAYVTEKHGIWRNKRYLGPIADVGVGKDIAQARQLAEDARRRRTMVSMLKRGGVPAPSLQLGRILEAVSNAGLFDQGLMLVGTAAFQCYSPIIGVVLGPTAMTTEDADFAATALAVSPTIAGSSLLEILRRADPTFRAMPNADRRGPPARFQSANGFAIDVVTKLRRGANEEVLPLVAGLDCGARPLRFLEYLLAEPINTVALYGAGVRVSVPSAERFAVHKLIVAQLRPSGEAKRNKDLRQAQELFDCLEASNPDALQDALDDARRRGRKWAAHIAASLKLIGRG